MTKSELKANVESTGSHFFERSSMKFFGDTMANYYVPVRPVDVDTQSFGKVSCYELQRRKPVKGRLSGSAYFHVETFRRVHEAK